MCKVAWVPLASVPGASVYILLSRLFPYHLWLCSIPTPTHKQRRCTASPAAARIQWSMITERPACFLSCLRCARLQLPGGGCGDDGRGTGKHDLGHDHHPLDRTASFLWHLRCVCGHTMRGVARISKKLLSGGPLRKLQPFSLELVLMLRLM